MIPGKHLNIGVVAHFAYGAMAGGEAGHVGGVERQTSLLCRWLAGRGHRVSLITWDEGYPENTVIDGVRLIRMCRQDAGLPGLRFFAPRWTSLVRAMHQAGADVYYQNCAEYVTGQVAMWSQHHRRAFVYSVASDPDCDPRLPTMHTLRERVLYRYGLRHADRIVVQTRHQQGMLKHGFGLSSEVLPMPCPGPSDAEYREPREPTAGSCHVLWAGRIAPVKRLEMLLAVAQALPEVTFHVAGMPYAGDQYSMTMLEQARGRINVVVHGMVPRQQMPELYRSMSLLCCTSLYEGFPNTFLEAWSHGLPIVSTVDPDHLIEQRQLGVAAGNEAELISAIRRYMESPESWRVMSGNARRHYLANYAVEPVMHKYEQLFLETVSESKR